MNLMGFMYLGLDMNIILILINKTAYCQLKFLERVEFQTCVS